MSVTKTLNNSSVLKNNKPLKIAIIHVADRGGGAERSVLTLHRSLREAGHDSQLYVGTKYLEEDAVEEISRDRPIPGLLRLTRWLENEVGLQALYAPWFRNLTDVIEPDVDLVHLHTLWGGQFSYGDLAGIMKLAKRFPMVMTLRDGWMLTGHCACPIGCERWKSGCGRCPDLQRTPAIKYDLTAWNWKRKQNAIQKSDLHITAVSTWLKEQIEESPIFAGKPVSVVHNSVDETEFTPGDKLQARRELGIDENKFVVLLAGQSIGWIEQGRSQHAVKALNLLNDSRFMPLLIGNVADRVAGTFTIPCKTIPHRESPEEMAQCYRAADLTIVPSEYETFGRVAAESQFCGTPVLAFATGGLTDVVDINQTGWLVPTGNIQAMAEQLRCIIEDRQELEARSASCQSWSIKRFAKEKICKDYVRVYETVLKKQRIGSSF